ncbi:hypothetical protein ACFLUN_00025 [Chloroflexota bacterium]
MDIDGLVSLNLVISVYQIDLDREVTGTTDSQSGWVAVALELTISPVGSSTLIISVAVV